MRVLHSPIAIHLTSLICLLLIATGCNTIGPRAIKNGRPLYNRVISETNAEQVLSLIVRIRYGNSAGMMKVASVTASIDAASKIQADAGFGAQENYDGNLVPLSATLSYQESPTISYVPIEWHKFMRQMLAPVSLDVWILLNRTQHRHAGLSLILLEEINGLRSPLLTDAKSKADFVEASQLMRSLYLTGFLDWGLVPDDPEAYELLMYHHDHAGQPGLHRLMELLELNVPEKDKGWTSFPVRDAVGAPVVEEIRIKTRSLIDIVRIAGACVNVPDEHIESGIANSVSSDIPRPEGLLEIKSSKRYPKNAMVATHQYGWWYYIDQTDATSKHSFNVLENLLYMRLAYAEGQTSKTPTLTIPVGR